MPDPQPVTLVLSRATLADGREVDIHLRGTVIGALEPAGSPVPEGAEHLPCAGHVVLPALVDGHIHLDKTLLGLPLIPHAGGPTVADRIANEKRLRQTLDLPVTARGGRLIEQVVAFGTGHLRSHVDIDTDQKLSGLDSLLSLRERYADRVSLQIVAFPQSGILRDPGTADLLDAALRSGADLVGGLDPAGIDDDVEGHLAVVFGLAEKHGTGVDIHLHDPGPLGCFELRSIAARTQAAGLGGRVAVSHAYALGAVDDAELGRTLEALARAGVAIMTNGPGTGTMPPLARLWAAGVRAFAGSDNIRDSWSPYGDGDMLRRVGLIGYRQDLCTPDEIAATLDMAMASAATVLGLDQYGCDVGRTADLLVLPVPSAIEAVLAPPASRTVLHQGRIVAGPNHFAAMQ